MRWEKFRALFNNLSPKSPFKRIIEIRQRSTKGLEGEKLASLQEAQNYYALRVRVQVLLMKRLVQCSTC